MTELLKAYNIGKRLALHKFAEEQKGDVADLTNKLDYILAKKNPNYSDSVLESSERSSSSSWGDKMELETPKNTGINV